MSLSNCEFCNSPAHNWLDCKKKPDGWKPDRMRRVATIGHVDHGKTSLAAADTQVLSEVVTPNSVERTMLMSADAVKETYGVEIAKNAPAPVVEHYETPKRGPGRPPSPNPKSPRAEYQRELMRKRRAAAKGSKP